MEQKCIRVDAKYNPDFKHEVKPTAFYLEHKGKLRRFEIDTITEETKAASYRLGISGIRYTCVSHGKQLYLYKDMDKWHIESKE